MVCDCDLYDDIHEVELEVATVALVLCVQLGLHYRYYYYESLHYTSVLSENIEFKQFNIINIHGGRK